MYVQNKIVMNEQNLINKLDKLLKFQTNFGFDIKCGLLLMLHLMRVHTL